jgi:hypothetical protein
MELLISLNNSKKKMKKIFIQITALGILLTSCTLDVLDNPKGITTDISQTADGAFLSTIGALKQGFDAHNNINYTTGLIGNEELQTTSPLSSFLAANYIERDGKLTSDNSQNRTIANLAYTSLSLASNARKGIDKSVANPNAKAILLANVNMIEGIVYGDLSKYYVSVPEAVTGNPQTPQQAKDKAIAALTEAIKQFDSFDPAGVDLGVSIKGLFIDKVQAIKFCNSFIGMLHFDTGAKNQAGAFLSKGYVKADIGKELGYKVINTLTGDGIYPSQRNYVEFFVNKYSDKFLAGRILSDTLRRTPSNWYSNTYSANTAGLRVAFNYFFPQGAGASINPVGSPTVTQYPVITWAEVALMQADAAVNQAVAKDVITDVLVTWRIPAATATKIAGDLSLEQVARYEYMGRGRRWAAVGTYPKWDLAAEFSFK